MSSAAKRTITLPADQADYVDALVTAGAYRSTSEVVRAGLQALQDRDSTTEQWLSEEAVPVYEAMVANPTRAIPAEAVRAAIDAHHATRLRAAKRGA